MSGLLGAISLGITATTTGISYHQKNKAQKKQARAEMDASKAMEDARRRLDVNYQEGMSISKDPYTMAIEASLQQGADAVQASRETQRGAANVGRIQTAQNTMLEGQRVAYGKELERLKQLEITEDSRLRDVNTQIDLEEVAGAQEAAARYEDEAAMAKQDVVAGVGSMAQQGLAMAPLYRQDMGAQKQAIAGMEFTPEQFGTFGNVKVGMGDAAGEGFSNMDFSSVGGMNNREFRQFNRGLTDAQKQQILFNPQYMENYKTYRSQQ